MTWLSAVSLGMAWAGGSPAPPDTPDPYRSIPSSVAVLTYQGSPTGMAVLIDSSGLFLAHRSAVAESPTRARTGDGGRLTLDQVAVDEATQLVLLESREPIPPGIAPVRVAAGPLAAGTPVVGAVPAGAFPGMISRINVPGILRPSLRYMPMTEMLFESLPHAVGGALVFASDQTLVGILAATLEPVGDPDGPNRQGVIVQQRNRLASTPPRMGPRAVTVGYSLGPEVLVRVVSGFRSPDRRVAHPAIGAFFGSAPRGGASVEAVMSNSPAERGGLRVGDVILRVGDRPIADQYQMVALIFQQSPGTTLRLTIRRGDREIELTVQVGILGSWEGH